jgi:hypothetical protein
MPMKFLTFLFIAIMLADGAVAQAPEAGAAKPAQNEVFHNSLTDFRNRHAAVVQRFSFDTFNPFDAIARYHVYEFNGVGFNWGNAGGWSVQHGLSEKGTFNTRGIGQMSVSNSEKHATGDFAAQYVYAYTDGGVTAQSDEGLTLDTREGGETDDWFHGTVAEGAKPGSTLLPVRYVPGPHSENTTTDGAYMLDISKGTISGIVTGPDSLVPGTSVHAMPVSAKLPVSTGIGVVTTPIPAIQVKNVPEKVRLSGVRLLQGSFTTGKACLAGGWYPEQVLIAEVGPAKGGSQDVTIIHKNPNGRDEKNPTSLWQGGICGQYISLDRNLDRDGFRTSYEAVGATDASHLAYVWNVKGATMSNMLKVYQAPVHLKNLSRSGGVVTASFAKANESYIFNQAPTVVIADASNRSFNGSVHMPEYVDDSSQVLKWSQAGPDEKATSATIDLPPSYYGFHLYPGAEVLGPQVAGGVPLEPNSVEWAPGDVIENPHHPSFAMNARMTEVFQHTLPNGYSSNGQRWDFFGSGISANYRPSAWRNANPCSLYIGCGGTLEPIRWNTFLGPYGEWLNIRNAPLNHGTLFTVGCDSRGCDHTPSYTLFDLQHGAMEYDPSNGNFTVPRMTAQLFSGPLSGPVTTSRIELQDPRSPQNAITITNSGGKMMIGAGQQKSDESMAAAVVGPGAGNAGGSAVCARGYSCTAQRGRLIVVASVAGAKGTIANVSTSLAQGTICTAVQNGGTAFFGIGSGRESANGFDITAGVALRGTLTIDYTCR